MRYTCLLLICLPFGCSGLSYKEPESGLRARVRFGTSTELVATLWRYADAQCSGEAEMMRLRKGPLINSSPKRLGIPLWDYHNNQALEVYIDAAKPFVALFKSEKGIGFEIDPAPCGVAFQVEFVPDADYEVLFDYTGKHCTVAVSQFINGENRIEKRSIPIAVLNNNAGCYSAFTKSRLY